MAKQAEWISEAEAAKMLGYTNLEAFRRNVKKGKLDISWTHTNGRNHQYDQKAILSHLNKNAVFVH